jgi:MFS family permease
MNLSALRQFSGTNAVTVYAGNIASSLVAGQLLLLIPSIVNFATFFGSFLSGFILSKFGRKTVVQAGTLAEVLANLMVVLGLYLSTDLSTAGQGALVLVGLFLCKLFFGTCIGPITWQYMPEVIETTLIPYTTTMNWVTGSIVITLFPILTNNVLNGNPGPLFMFFIVYCALSFVFNWRFMVETRGRTQT